jgi:hypothetical protein
MANRTHKWNTTYPPGRFFERLCKEMQAKPGRGGEHKTTCIIDGPMWIVFFDTGTRKMREKLRRYLEYLHSVNPEHAKDEDLYAKEVELIKAEKKDVGMIYVYLQDPAREGINHPVISLWLDLDGDILRSEYKRQHVRELRDKIFKMLLDRREGVPLMSLPII